MTAGFHAKIFAWEGKHLCGTPNILIEHVTHFKIHSITWCDGYVLPESLWGGGGNFNFGGGVPPFPLLYETCIIVIILEDITGSKNNPGNRRTLLE